MPPSARKYDELGANWRAYEQGGARRAVPKPVRPASGTPTRAAAVPVQAVGFRTMTQEEMEEMFGDQEPVLDFFTTFFGGGGFRPARRPSARGGRARARDASAGGADVEHEIELSLGGTPITQRNPRRAVAQSTTVMHAPSTFRIPAGVGGRLPREDFRRR